MGVLSQILLISFCYIFPSYEKIRGKIVHFSCGVEYQSRNLMEEKQPYSGKSMIPKSHFSPIEWVLLNFPMLLEING